jgi:predicted deacylase
MKREHHGYQELPTIDISSYPSSQVSNFFLRLYENALGVPVKVPFIVAKGTEEYPVVGITAAVHGNELNGIRIIHGLLKALDMRKLKGTLLCVPVVNVPAFNLGQRYFIDGTDLNTVFPGNRQGPPSAQYARAFFNTFLPSCNYLIDIHTASEGRINSLYVRADLRHDIASKMARLFDPEIILHSTGGGKTLRNAAHRHGIPAITVEAGNPAVIQGKMIREGVRGITNILSHFGMLNRKPNLHSSTVICTSSKWLRTTGGGLLTTTFSLRERISKNATIAEQIDCFGSTVASYTAPYDGVVIGMASDPTSVPGTRYCHLGKVGTEAELEYLSAQPFEVTE